MSNSTTSSSSSSFSLSSSSTDRSTSSVDTSSFSSSIFSSSSTPASTTSSTSLATFTSHITVSPTGTDTSQTVVTITSTASPSGTTSGNLASESAAAASSSSRAAALATSGASSSNNGSLSSGGKIAVAVVVPIVGIALIVAALIFFWKKRKARKNAEEERRKEVEEYGYNPNNDPTLPAVGSTYGETNSEMAEDNSGYRGWGTTSTQRKASTTLGSNGRAQIGMAVSDTTSNTGPHNSQPSEGNSGDPLMNGGHDRPDDAEPVGALGGAPGASTQNRDLNRGPSNASSSYTGHRSDGSGEGEQPVNGGYPPQNYYDEVTYYNEAQPNHGPYGDGSYGGGQGQPVIRDVQARRNTKIEKPSVFPQQGNAGIAQNF